MNTLEQIIDKLKSENAALSKKIENYQSLESKYESAFEELREKEEFNFALFQYSPITTVIVDREGRVVKSNAAKRKSGDRLPNIGDVMYLDYASHHSIDMYKELMTSIQTGQSKDFPEMHYQDKGPFNHFGPFSQGRDYNDTGHYRPCPGGTGPDHPDKGPPPGPQ
jgi:hypothetical protein